MTSPIVAVRGESTREVDPEIADFVVTVNARDKDRATTLARLADRIAALRAILDGYAAAIEKRETSRMSVYAETKRAGEKITAYVGNATTNVTVTDLDVLGEMMLRVVANEQTSVTGPFWSVRPGSPVSRDARHAAIADAVTRAKEYAEALGARVIGLVELTDAGMSGPTLTPLSMSFAKSRGDMGGEPELDLDPQRQQINAQVEGRFRISEPTILAEPID
jgi:uncharacterized protein YggE